jgi:hypothetical protein
LSKQYHIRWRKCQKYFYVTQWQKKYPWLFLTSLSLYIFTIARASSNYSDFLKRHLHLRNKLLDQGYTKIRLIRSLKKFIFRYQDLVEIYSQWQKKYPWLFLTSLSLYIFTIWKCIAYIFFLQRRNIFRQDLGIGI